MRKYQYYNTNDDNDRDGYGTNWMAQTFTPETDHIIGSVKLKLFRVGDPGTITVSIKATSGGKPMGADLCSGTIEGTEITLDTNGEWYEISLGDGFDLDIGAQYAIVIKAVDGDASNKVSWRADITSPTYTGGTYCDSSDSGVDWSTYSGVDCMFEEWGVGPASPTTITWGNLYKSQISSEKIEEAIARMIQDHEDDPDAHLEVGESLYSHKASEIIDHIVQSIIADKIKDGEVIDSKLANIDSWRRLLAVDPAGAVEIFKSVWTGESGENYAVSLTADGTYIYAALGTSPAKVKKINPATMETVATWTGESGENSPMSICHTQGFVFVMLDTAPGQIIKIDPETMAKTDKWTGPAGSDYAYSMTADRNHIYAGLFITPGKVIKINPATMETVATWTGAAGENFVRAVAFDGDYIYAGLYLSPSRVIKINKSTMATDSSITFSAGENYLTALCYDGNHIHAGLNISPSKVKKIRPTDMSIAATWTGAAGENYLTDLVFDGLQIYAVMQIDPFKLAKIKIEDMTTISVLTGAAGETNGRGLTFDGFFIYIGTLTSPGKVIRRIIRNYNETN